MSKRTIPRNLKLSPYKQMGQASTRTSYRRKYFSNSGGKDNDRVWHRAMKRSLKHFMKTAMLLELQEAYEHFNWIEDTDFYDLLDY